jgi:hypothetical protein
VIEMLKQVMEMYDLLDSAYVDGEKVATFLKGRGMENVQVERIKGKAGSTDFIRIFTPGKEGKSARGKAPTLGIVGRLGGIGARPQRIGIVSDADGAVVALSCALKLAEMKKNGDMLKGDVISATHICPSAPTQPHDPVPFMGSPVDIATMNKHEIDPTMDAVLSVDSTKGNRIAKWRGFAITPTVKEGWILRVSDDLISIMEWVTGKTARVVPITMQDITPYGNQVYHVNSIMQPSVATEAPVVGVAITTETPVPGCATGVGQMTDIEESARFCLEVAKSFAEGGCKLYDEEEFNLVKKLYGSMKHLQSLGKNSGS